MCVNPRDDSDATLSFRKAMKKGDETLKQFVTKHYKNIGWKTNDILSAMMESNDFYASEIVRVKPLSLYNGRFVPVGDAGYALGFTGGGITLAMTGAYILAGEVCEHKDDLAAGLEGYEKQMRPFITDLQYIPPLIPTVLGPQTAWGIAVRNYLFAFITWTRILELIQKYFCAAFASSDKYKLKDYAWVA